MPYEEEEQELSLLDVFNVLWRRKFMIIFFGVIFGTAAIFYALSLPTTYRAECRIMAQSSGSGGMAGFAAQLGGLADFVGLPRSATSGQMLIGILKGNTVVDAIIDKFNLMEEMSTDVRLRVRSSVLASLEANEESRSGIITIAYINIDPERASDMANSFVDELQKKLQDMSLKNAQKHRNFFESQLIQAQQELNAAEDAMIAYQQSSGVIAFESQAQSLLSSIASLRNQIAAKNIQLSSLLSYARPDNPRVKSAKSELEAMSNELRRLEEEQLLSDSRRRTVSGDLVALSVGQFPELGIEYQRYVRALKFATAKYELMMRQYENARLSEANDLSTISIIDPATPPDSKYGPRRTRIVMIGAAGGVAFGVFLAFLIEHLIAVKRARRYAYADGYDDEDDE